jgi:3-oxoacyl-[acyl-carrier protein] reductase
MQAKYQTDPAYKNDKAKQTERKRTAIVTGSGRGIGKETAILLAKKGVNVVICSRTEEQINSVVQEIKKEINDDQDNNNIVIGVKCDVSISSQIDCLVKSAINKFGPDSIDILVNNAGVVFNKKLVDTSEKEWDQTINTNLKGAFLVTKAVLPYMIARKSGVIINVNSGAAKAGFKNLSSYCASKFGLLGLSESASLEVDSYNIRIISICLGQVATKMWQDFDYNYYERNKNKMLKPQDVGERIVEMIFDAESYKNGKVVEMYNL